MRFLFSAVARGWRRRRTGCDAAVTSFDSRTFNPLPQQAQPVTRGGGSTVALEWTAQAKLVDEAEISKKSSGFFWGGKRN